MDYITEIVKNSRLLLLQQAKLKANGVPIALAAVAEEVSDSSKEALKDMGAWFQNVSLSVVSKNSGPAKTDPEFVFDRILKTKDFDFILQEASKEGISFAFLIGEGAYFFGENIRISSAQFGKTVEYKAGEGFAYIEKGVRITVDDGRRESSIFIELC